MTGIADSSVMRLPRHTFGDMCVRLALSALIHAVGLALAASVVGRASTGDRAVRATADSTVKSPAVPVLLPRIVFLRPREPGTGSGGGGGGGNRDPRPIRRAEAHGHDRATLSTRVSAPIAGPGDLIEDRAPAVLLDARPLASGDSIHAGLPLGGVSYGTSQGPGSGGGVGTGTGTGIGPGQGPGIGPGSGGGIGGGTYVPGGNVTAPRLLHRVNPRYTADALERRIQGEVWLDVVVARTGMATSISVMRSLDPGLDREAIAALQQWRFAPGELLGSPVDVQVTVVMAFWIH